MCPRKKSEKELKNIVRVSGENELEISEVVVQQDFVVLDDEQLENNIRYVELCIKVFSSLGIKTINVFTGPVPWAGNPVRIGKDISEGNAWDKVFYAFDRIVGLAGQYNMNLALENVWGMLCHDFYTARFLIDYYDSQWLGVNYDPSHDVLAGRLDVGWVVKKWGKKNIKHIHLKDAAGIQENGKFIFPLLGEGYVDWPAFSGSLHDIGYEGCMSVEFESFEYLRKILDNDFESAARLSMENIKKII